MTFDAQKLAAAKAALHFVKPGMKLGLGTGSTARHFVDCIGDMVKAGFEITCVPTSEITRKQAESLNIPLTTLDQSPMLDLTVDGADEIDGAMNLIKGGGGALLREKIVASSSRLMVVIADASKRVETLGAFALPVEVVPFGVKATAWKIERAIKHAGCQGALTLRVRDGQPFLTDHRNVIIDCALGRIPDPPRLAGLLSGIPGVVEHGLFVGLAAWAAIASADGVTMMERRRT